MIWKLNTPLCPATWSARWGEARRVCLRLSDLGRKAKFCRMEPRMADMVKSELVSKRSKRVPRLLTGMFALLSMRLDSGIAD